MQWGSTTFLPQLGGLTDRPRAETALRAFNLLSLSASRASILHMLT